MSNCLTMIEEQELIRKGGAGRDGYCCSGLRSQTVSEFAGEATVLPSDRRFPNATTRRMTECGIGEYGGGGAPQG
jgi:hypothetical protein